MSAADDTALEAEVARQHALIMRGTAFGDVETRATMERELRERLAISIREQRPLRVYLGVDPTAPDLHLGHVVGLRKLRTFSDLGHQAILLIGDLTGLVGDPSDKDSLRPMSTMDQLTENSRTYQAQAVKVLDPDRTEVRRNSEWLGKLDFADVIRLASHFTVAQFIERDTFAKRLQRGDPVYVHEFMYGLMQGYDAVALRADVQIGGTDQTFNLIAGRILQRAYDQPPQVAITFPILVGLDGKARMSKSQGNHIGIDEPADEQYGKAMSIPDEALGQFFTLGTNLSADDVAPIERGLSDGSLHPMEAKQRLARAVVSEWHGPAAAEAAAAHFTNVFSKREIPEEMPEVALPFDGGPADVDLAVLLTEAGVVKSKAEVKRLVAQGGVQRDGQPFDSPQVQLAPGDVLKIGKRRWLRVVARARGDS